MWGKAVCLEFFRRKVVIITAFSEYLYNCIFKFAVNFYCLFLVINKASRNSGFSAHCADTVLMPIRKDHFYFRAIISAACFKISASISSSFTRFLIDINSFSSGVLLSLALNDSVLLKSLTHFVTLDFDTQ